MKEFNLVKLLATAAILITVLLWGFSFVSIKIVVAEVPPLTMALLRFTIATIVLLLIFRRVEPQARLAKEDWGKMSLTGFLGVTLYFVFENLGVKMTTASSASLITSIIPIVAIIADVLVFKTKISFSRWLGVWVAVIGTYLVVTANGQLNFHSGAFQGNLLMIGAMLSWVVYTIITKAFQGKYSGLFLTTYQALFGTILLIPLSFLEYSQWQAFSLEAFAHILFLALGCSALCYFLYIYALDKLDVAVTTIYLNLIPIVGVISGYLFLHETILPIQLLGGAIIVLGILVVNFSQDWEVGSEKASL